MSIMAGQPLSLFYCYAPGDAELCLPLLGQLAPIRRQGWIQIWSEDTVESGMEWQSRVENYLNTSDIILLVMSADFIASDYYYALMEKAMHRHWQQKAIVIPVLLKPCSWQDTIVGTLPPLPQDGRAISTQPRPDEAWQQIALRIREIVKSRRQWMSIFYATADILPAQRLQHDLEAHKGIELKSMDGELEDSETQREKVRQMVRASQAVLLLVSPHIRPLRYIFDIVEMYRDDVHITLIWIAGETWQSSLIPTWRQFPLIDARGDHYEQAINEIAGRLAPTALLSSSTSAYQPDSYTLEQRRNPYKGLRSFQSSDAKDFFGRGELARQLLHTLHQALDDDEHHSKSARLLTLVGPSGSGKSSLLMAGLLPLLRQETLAEVRNWILLDPITPGKQPIQSLAETLVKHFPEMSLVEMKKDLEINSALGLHNIAKRIIQNTPTKVLLLVDQFEEVFTQTISEQERQLFIDILAAAVSEPRGPVVVLLALRADFYGHPMYYPQLNDLIQSYQVQMLSMSLHELRDAIEGPARLPDVCVSFEEGLVGDLLFDVQGQAGALPLLQFTLEQLFEQRNEDNQLTLQAYDQLGRIKGALEKRANETYHGLPTEDHRVLARLLFLRLVEPGITLQDATRRRAALSEFVLPDKRRTEALHETIEAFIQARLLTTDRRGDTLTLEVSHETLIREWRLLAEWLHVAQKDIPVQRAIHRDAEAWQEANRAGSQLYQGFQLKQAQIVAGHTLTMLNGVEKAFLDASREQQARRFSVRVSLLLVAILITGSLMFVLYQINVISRTTVSSLDDNGLGSLRQVLTTAPPGSTITFNQNLKGTITLSSDDLNIAKNVTLQGPGSNILAIRSTGQHSFQVLNGASVTINGLGFKDSNLISKDAAREFIFNQGRLFLKDVTITGNVAAHSITNAGTLTCTQCTISNNRAVRNGGGISNTGTLTLIRCIIASNTTDASHTGGGVANDYGGTLTLVSTSVINNSALGSNGGGIANNSGKLTLTDSLVANNSATLGGGIYNAGTLTIATGTIAHNISSNGGYGGGIYNTGTFSLMSSTIAYNTSNGGSGGGIATIAAAPSTGGAGIAGTARFLPASSTLVNSTIGGNKALNINGSGGYGGGIFAQGDQVTITFCTLAENIASRGEGGIATAGGAGKGPTRITLGESIVAADQAPFAPDIAADSVSATSSYNLFQGVFGILANSSSNHSIIGVAPHLSPLQDNHGSTQTYALQPDSPAIDQVPLSICQLTKILIDQRNVKRPQGPACDLGAYEYVAP